MTVTLEVKMSAIDYYKDLDYVTLERCGFPSNYYMMTIEQRDLMDAVVNAVNQQHLDEIESLQEELEVMIHSLEEYQYSLEDLSEKLKSLENKIKSK